MLLDAAALYSTTCRDTLLHCQQFQGPSRSHPVCAEVHNLVQRNDRLVNEVHKSISVKNLSDQKMRTRLLKAESQAHTQVSQVCWSHIK